jgi:hypothetical protein
MAEQLMQIAEQYQCQILYDWANTLKNQAEFFDLARLPKTLANFQNLLNQLNNA